MRRFLRVISERHCWKLGARHEDDPASFALPHDRRVHCITDPACSDRLIFLPVPLERGSERRIKEIRKTRCSDEHIISVLDAAKAGAKMAELARRHGVLRSDHMQLKYGGLELFEARWLSEVADITPASNGCRSVQKLAFWLVQKVWPYNDFLRQTQAQPALTARSLMRGSA